MPQFFIKQQNMGQGFARVEGDDYRHLVRVRRIKTGNILYLTDEAGRMYYGPVTEIGRDHVKVSITGSYERPASGLNISLYMCLIKGANFEFAIQKAAEVGVNRIIPVISERTVPDPDRKLEQKRARWNRIAAEACKQCMRGTTLHVGLPLPFADAISIDNSQVKIICHPGASADIREHLLSCGAYSSAGIIIGPEGGFSDNELEAARGAGWAAVNFGFTQLRSETAAVVISALVIFNGGSL